jgi:23S rRNA pseudouridine1911/1915/1917 synthase
VERVLTERLDVALDHAAKLLRQGRVLRGGAPLALGDRLAAGDLLEVHPRSGDRPPPAKNRKVRVHLLHEDPHLLALSKPSGRVVHPGPGHGNDTLLNGLVARFPELLDLGEEREFGLVHRLDRGTSGVLLVARTPEAYVGLVAAFKAREVEKEYWALTRGAPPEGEGLVDRPIDGKEARTRYRVVAAAGDVALVEAHPLTGRTHQVRIHLANLGCPVLGDEHHGGGLDDVTARLHLSRLALHARRVALTHPVTGERLEVIVEPPKRLRRAWKRAARTEEEPDTLA